MGMEDKKLQQLSFSVLHYKNSQVSVDPLCLGVSDILTTSLCPLDTF